MEKAIEPVAASPVAGPVAGEIRWYHVARSRALRRIIDRSISRWVANESSREQAPPAHYRAVLQREGDGHLIHCEIEVVAGSRTWRGARVGQGIQQALADCLAHMRLSSPQPLRA